MHALVAIFAILLCLACRPSVVPDLRASGAEAWLKDGQVLLKVTGAAEAVALAARSVGAGKQVVDVKLPGDPLELVDAKALHAGDTEHSVTSWIRPVRAPAGSTCVLAEQSYGFEHVKRNHSVICQKGVAWQRKEGQGPTWTSVDIRDLDGDGVDEVLYFDGFFAPDGVDRLDATVLKWVGGELKEAPITVPTVTAGSFRSLAEARAAQKRAERCNQTYFVLEAEKGAFALAAKSNASASVVAKWKDWQACGSPGLTRTP